MRRNRLKIDYCFLRSGGGILQPLVIPLLCSRQRIASDETIKRAAQEAYADLLVPGGYGPGTVADIYTEIDGAGWLVRLYLRAELWLEVSSAWPVPL